MQCKICAAEIVADEVSYRNEGRHRNEIFDRLRILVCNVCGSSWADNPPTSQQLANYYADNYVPTRMQSLEKGSWPIWDGRPASMIVLARLFTEFQPGDFFIDVGPGNGASLSLAPYLLPKPRLGCVEFNKKSIRFFEKHSPHAVIRSSMSSFIDEHGQCSVRMIYSAHCLEHFRADDLERELVTLHHALSQSGVLTIEVPYAGERRMMVSNHSPHLVFFTPKGLKLLLRRTGFNVRLCFTAVGRTRRGEEYVDQILPAPLPNETGKRFAARVSTLNIPDLVGKIPKKAESAVIKCVATKDVAE